MSKPTGEPTPFEAYQQRLAKEREQACQTLKGLFDFLRSLNIHTVTISYDGCSDSGAVEDVRAFDANNQEVWPSGELHDELVELAERLLPSGWEINEGSFGQYTFDVPNRKLLREHSQRIEPEYDEETWQA